ncbi:MAG: electron transport complex subunit RsxE [Pedobacter sp.]
MRPADVFLRGLWSNNAIFRLVLGMCPTLAVTTSAKNGLGMGLATTFVLLCSNVAISAIRRIIPGKVRIPAFIVVIATFVTVVQLVMEAYAFALYQALGIFIPLIVVNCLILGRAEAFASRQPILVSIADGAGMGFGFTLALVSLGAVRELLGAGQLFGLPLLGSVFHPMLLMVLPPGAFLALGFLLAAINSLPGRKPPATGN